MAVFHIPGTICDYTNKLNIRIHGSENAINSSQDIQGWVFFSFVSDEELSLVISILK